MIPYCAHLEKKNACQNVEGGCEGVICLWKRNVFTEKDL